MAATRLAEGSNAEGADPSPPLGWRSPADLRDVVLYGPLMSPSTVKIRTYLTYFKIPFEHELPSKPDSDYTKDPVLDVAGRQVKDSEIILKYLIPALTGKPFDEVWEDRITYQLELSMEADMDNADIAAFLGPPHGVGMPFLCVWAPLIKMMFSRSLDKAFDTVPKAKRVDPLEIGQLFRTAIGNKPFYGGTKPTQPDISLYGTLARFKFTDCLIAEDFLEGSDLEGWWSRMEAEIPLSALYPDDERAFSLRQCFF